MIFFFLNEAFSHISQATPKKCKFQRKYLAQHSWWRAGFRACGCQMWYSGPSVWGVPLLRDHLSLVWAIVSKNRHYSLTEVEVSLQTILCFLLSLLSVLFQSIIFRSLCNVWNIVNWFCYYSVSYSSTEELWARTTHVLTGTAQLRNTTSKTTWIEKYLLLLFNEQ